MIGKIITLPKELTEKYTLAFDESNFCDCEKPKPRQYGANERKDCAKHHWRCDKCDKIIQIG